MSRSGAGFAGRVYAVLVRFLPADVRRLFGAAMAETFERTYAEVRRDRGWGAGLRYVLRAWADAVVTGLAERGRRMVGRRQEPATLEAHMRLALRGDIGSAWTDLAADLRFALRQLVRRPGASGLIVGTLALAIGATTAVYSAVHAVLLSPLPYAEPDRLVVVRHLRGEERLPGGISGPDLLDYGREASSFAGFAGMSALGTNLTDAAGAERVVLSWVTPDFFEVMGVEATLGRTLGPGDRAVTAFGRITRPDYVPPAVPAVLSHGLWQRRFGEDRGVLGRALRINGQAMTVVGVMPPDFRMWLGPGAELQPDVDVWTLIPVPLSEGARGGGGFTVVGRLAPGVSLEDARTEMASLTDRLRETYAVHAEADTQVELAPLAREAAGEAGRILWALFAGVALVLLVACANVASLLLVRARAREGELAVRSALGGGRGRLARQMLTESLVLAGAGTVGGLLVARWTIGLISVLRPGELPRAEEIGLRGSALLFAAAITAFVALAVGLAPALRAARTRAGAVRGGAAPRRPARTRPLLGIHGGLIVAEVALSVVLVISAGLLVRSLQELRRLDPGFEAQGVVAATVSLPFFSYREEAARVRFYDAFADALRELPGVEASALSAWLPLAQEGWVGGWLKPGEPATRWAVNAVEYRSVSPGYFAAVGTPIVHGRALVSTDERPGEPPVVVVDRRFADRAWPGLDPLGERLLIAVPGESQAGEAVEVSVVGVAESARLRDLRQAGAGAVYMPMRLNPWFRASALVRTDASPAAVGAALEGALAAIDLAVPLYEVRPLTEYVDDAMAPVRFATALMMAFAGLALVLAGVGLFGVVSSAVQQRSREIGLRVALGAAPASVVGMVVRAGLGLTLVGVGLGVAASAALTGGLAFTLFGVAPTDPAAFAGAAVVIVAVAVVACLVPARRAARVDPAVTLRAD